MNEILLDHSSNVNLTRSLSEAPATAAQCDRSATGIRAALQSIAVPSRSFRSLKLFLHIIERSRAPSSMGVFSKTRADQLLYRVAYSRVLEKIEAKPKPLTGNRQLSSWLPFRPRRTACPAASALQLPFCKRQAPILHARKGVRRLSLAVRARRPQKGLSIVHTSPLQCKRLRIALNCEVQHV